MQDFLNGPMTESDMGHVTPPDFGRVCRDLDPSGHGNEAEWGLVPLGRHGNEAGTWERGWAEVTSGSGMTSRKPEVKDSDPGSQVTTQILLMFYINTVITVLV